MDAVERETLAAVATDARFLADEGDVVVVPREDHVGGQPHQPLGVGEQDLPWFDLEGEADVTAARTDNHWSMHNTRSYAPLSVRNSRKPELLYVFRPQQQVATD